ncbi:flavin reductase family protein [Rhizobium lusitanum]|uniref:flavin reductase family protein n=1 Tax=Rhizobium lusitanum TaxID=293958 RepID=UPI0035E445CA
MSPVTPEAFRTLFKTHAASVSIVTTMDNSIPIGFTLTSVSSVSADPPIVAFSVMETSSCWPAISRAETVVVHFLDEDQLQLAQRFATSGIDRFDGVDWDQLPGGAPRLRAVRRWAPCRIMMRHPAGASRVILASLGPPVVEPGPGPLLYLGRGYRKLDREIPHAC